MQSPVNGARRESMRYRDCGTQQRYAHPLAKYLSSHTKLSKSVRDQLRDETAGPRKSADIAGKRLSPGASLDELREPSQNDDQSEAPPDCLELFPHDPRAGSKHEVAE